MHPDTFRTTTALRTCLGHRVWPWRGGLGASRAFKYQLLHGWAGEGLLAPPASSEPFKSFKSRLFQTPLLRPEASLSSSVLRPFQRWAQTWARRAAFLRTQALPSRDLSVGRGLGAPPSSTSSRGPSRDSPPEP
uniref:Uncharacterized protein n=1 Tax=Rousettus aegyptiacus TaxID=9407 RepID=A0A7J8D6U5_ROUAE|nr:hypothetical protein HJG63_008870 [Rousettus aegyptiacus]